MKDLCAVRGIGPWCVLLNLHLLASIYTVSVFFSGLCTCSSSSPADDRTCARLEILVRAARSRQQRL